MERLDSRKIIDNLARRCKDKPCASWRDRMEMRFSSVEETIKKSWSYEQLNRDLRLELEQGLIVDYDVADEYVVYKLYSGQFVFLDLRPFFKNLRSE